MELIIKIGIIGDYDGRPSHIATNEAIRHCSQKLGFASEVQWISTDTLTEGVGQKLNSFDGLWCAPGSPYKSMTGAVNAIQYARENKIPFIGTCGGFQHAVLEYARDVLKIKEVAEEDFDLYSPNAFISQLSCSLVGQTRHILLDRNSFIYDIYGKPETEEKYNCNFGLNKDFQNDLDQAGFKVVGTDEQGEARIMVLDNRQFYLATLFQPQLTSTPDHPHPLILAYLSYVRDFNQK